MQKKITAILLSLLMSVQALPFFALAEEAETPTESGISLELPEEYSEQNEMTEETAVEEAHEHEECGCCDCAEADLLATHSHSGWTGITSLPTTAGNYYLTKDITISSQWKPASGTTTLCLNGYVLKTTSSIRLIYINSGCNLIIEDCNSTGKSHKFTVGSNGLYSLNETSGTETITGGVITGGNCADDGGAICIAGGSLTLNGGTIVGNKSGDHGAVKVGGGSFTMNGGAITGNVSPDWAGGGVCVAAGYTFTMNGGTISYNCGTSGGGILNNGTFNMYGGTISNNKATSSSGSGGGGVNNGGTFNMYGGTITGNSVNGKNGGGVASIKTFNMSGGTISNNSANNGAGVDCNGGTASISGGTISNNTAVFTAGGLCIHDSATVTMSGGKIINNTANGTGTDNGGGGINMWSSAKFTMTGGEISGNTAKYYGGAIREKESTVIINGGYIGPNTATNYTGIYKASGTVTYTKGRFDTSNTYSTTPSTANTYAITLNKNGGTGGTSSLSASYKGSMPTISTLPTRDGYHFLGYYTETSGGYKYYNADGSPALSKWDYYGALTLYAHWGAHSYVKHICSGCGAKEGTAKSELLPYDEFSEDNVDANYCYNGTDFVVTATEGYDSEGVFVDGDSRLTVQPKDPSIVIDRVEAVIGYYGERYASIGVSSGTKQETGTVSDGDTVHINNVNASGFAFIGGGQLVQFKDITVYYTVISHDFTGAYKNNGDGTHSRKCTKCDEYGTSEAHNYLKHICTECGAAELAMTSELLPFDTANEGGSGYAYYYSGKDFDVAADEFKYFGMFGGTSDKTLTILPKYPYVVIDHVDAVVLTYPEDYADVGVSSGEKQTYDELFEGSTVRINDINAPSFAFKDGADYSAFGDITVYYMGLAHDFTGTDCKDNGDGTHSHKCTGCDEYGAPEAHTFVKHVCACGALETEQAPVSKSELLTYDANNEGGNGYNYYHSGTDFIVKSNCYASVDGVYGGASSSYITVQPKNADTFIDRVEAVIGDRPNYYSGVGISSGVKREDSGLSVGDTVHIDHVNAASFSFVNGSNYASFKDITVYYKDDVVLAHDFTGDYKDNGDGTHSHQCTKCDELGGTPEAHIDEDEDEICDVCLTSLHVCVDANKDNFCDKPNCGKEIYIERSWDDTNKKVVNTYKAIPEDAVGLTSSYDNMTLEAGTCYYAEGTVSKPILYVKGTPENPTTLILKDGCNLSVSCITVTEGYALYICGQNGDSGSLTATGTSYPGIGGTYEVRNAGDINICGGTVTANCRQNSGIGVYEGGTTGTITIYGGTVSAACTDLTRYAAGICAGVNGSITIYDGVITANGGCGAAGIGGASGCTPGTVTICGGTVTATGGKDRDMDYYGGPGIGGGYGCGEGGSITISGGDITAIGGCSNTPGIGGGQYGKHCTLNVTCDVTVKAGKTDFDTDMTVDEYKTARSRYVRISHIHAESAVDNGDGTHSVICDICGETITDRIKHTFGTDGLCTVCGAKPGPTVLNLSSIRTTGVPGLRFAAYVTSEQREASSSYGFLVARENAALKSDPTKLTFNSTNSASGKNKFDITYTSGVAYDKANGIDKVYSEDGEVFGVSDVEAYFFTGVMQGIPKAYSTENLVARPYMVVDGVTLYGNTYSKSLYASACAIREGGYEGLDDAAKAYIDDIIESDTTMAAVKAVTYTVDAWLNGDSESTASTQTAVSNAGIKYDLYNADGEKIDSLTADNNYTVYVKRCDEDAAPIEYYLVNVTDPADYDKTLCGSIDGSSMTDGATGAAFTIDSSESAHTVNWYYQNTMNIKVTHILYNPHAAVNTPNGWNITLLANGAEVASGVTATVGGTDGIVKFDALPLTDADGNYITYSVAADGCNDTAVDTSIYTAKYTPESITASNAAKDTTKTVTVLNSANFSYVKFTVQDYEKSSTKLAGAKFVIYRPEEDTDIPLYLTDTFSDDGFRVLSTDIDNALVCESGTGGTGYFNLDSIETGYTYYAKPIAAAEGYYFDPAPVSFSVTKTYDATSSSTKSSTLTSVTYKAVKLPMLTFTVTSVDEDGSTKTLGAAAQVKYQVYTQDPENSDKIVKLKNADDTDCVVTVDIAAGSSSGSVSVTLPGAGYYCLKQIDTTFGLLLPENGVAKRVTFVEKYEGDTLVEYLIEVPQVKDYTGTASSKKQHKVTVTTMNVNNEATISITQYDNTVGGILSDHEGQYCIAAYVPTGDEKLKTFLSSIGWHEDNDFEDVPAISGYDIYVSETVSTASGEYSGLIPGHDSSCRPITYKVIELTAPQYYYNNRTSFEDHSIVEATYNDSCTFYDAVLYITRAIEIDFTATLNNAVSDEIQDLNGAGFALYEVTGDTYKLVAAKTITDGKLSFTLADSHFDTTKEHYIVEYDTNGYAAFSDGTGCIGLASAPESLRYSDLNAYYAGETYGTVKLNWQKIGASEWASNTLREDESVYFIQMPAFINYAL